MSPYWAKAKALKFIYRKDHSHQLPVWAATDPATGNPVTSHRPEGVLLPWNKAAIESECLLAGAEEGFL